VVIPKGLKVRRLHKAFLRYHDPDNWPILREALRRMGRGDLIGNGPQHLIPAFQPPGTGLKAEGRRTARDPARARPPATGRLRTQHTGLPPRGRGRGK